MTEFLQFTVSGLATSAIYAIAASGLVLTYTSTGTFNFAQGAIGMIAAFTYWQLRFAWHIPAIIALAICLLVLAPIVGYGLELLVMRRLEGAPEATRLVVTVALMVALLGLALWIWNPQTGRDFPLMLQGSNVSLGSVRVTAQEIIDLAVAVGMAVGLRALLFGSRSGIAMRAAVDNRNLARLYGSRPDRGSVLAWVIGVSLAALAGILIAPTLSLSALPLTLLIVNAYAAAVIGRLRNLPLTFLGALLLGMLGEYLPDYLRSSGGSQYLQGMYLSIPVLVLFIALVVLPRSGLRQRVIHRGREIVPTPSLTGGATFIAVVLAGSAMVGSLLTGSDLQITAGMFGMGIVALSLVPLVGFAGRVSLCQLTIAGVGAISMGHISPGGSPWGLLASAAIAGLVGLLITLPVLRLSGIYLALATAAVAVIADQWIFVLPPFNVFGHRFNIFNSDSLSVQLPHFFGWRPTTGFERLMVMSVAFCVCAGIVLSIRRSRFGLHLLAMKESESASATLGRNLTVTKLLIFGLSAAMAGFGGAMYAGSLRVVDSSRFDFFTGLPILLAVVIGGVSTVGGALFAALFIASPLMGDLFHSYPELPLVLSGVAAVTMGRDPNGFIIRSREEWKVVWRPKWVGTVTGLILVVWILRKAGLYGNWAYAVLSLVVLAVTPRLVAWWEARSSRPEAIEGPVERQIPLEWVGLVVPYTEDHIDQLTTSMWLPPVESRA